MLGGSHEREGGLLGLLESSSASTSVLQKVTSTPMGSLSETSVAAARQRIHSRKLSSLISAGKMEGIHKKKR